MKQMWMARVHWDGQILCAPVAVRHMGVQAKLDARSVVSQHRVMVPTSSVHETRELALEALRAQLAATNERLRDEIAENVHLLREVAELIEKAIIHPEPSGTKGTT